MSQVVLLQNLSEKIIVNPAKQTWLLIYNLRCVTLVFIDINHKKIRLTLTPYDKQSNTVCVASFL